MLVILVIKFHDRDNVEGLYRLHAFEEPFVYLLPILARSESRQQACKNVLFIRSQYRRKQIGIIAQAHYRIAHSGRRLFRHPATVIDHAVNCAF